MTQTIQSLASRTERASGRSLPLVQPSVVSSGSARALPAVFAENGSELDSVELSLLLGELQISGMRLDASGLSRSGGAGPSDHKAVKLGGHTVMVPIFTRSSQSSAFNAVPNDGGTHARLTKNGVFVATVEFPVTPRFYAHATADGTPYWKIATLHASDVLATTVLQTCTRFGHRETSCQFCAIGQSLAKKSTIARKTPEQLAEVARAAVALDGVKHMVMTTGTPAGSDRGAAVLAQSARAVTQAVSLPIQAQCEPPDDFDWFSRLKAAGVATLGMHLEAVTEPVRARIMPGKAEVPVRTYLRAFESAVGVFGRGQVTTYILAGLGDTADEIIGMSAELSKRGVYPFVVPFVPISGTPLQNHRAPSSAFMDQVLGGVAKEIDRYGLSSDDMSAGCGRCGACSTLKVREQAKTATESGARA